MSNSIMKVALVVLIVLITLGASVALASPYSRLPKAGDQIRFDNSVAGQHAAWAYPDQGWLETFLRLAIDAALNGTKSDDEQTAVHHARQRGLVIDNGTQGLVTELRPFHYRAHDDVEVQVLIREGPLRNRIYWTTAAELVDSNGHKYLK